MNGINEGELVIDNLAQRYAIEVTQNAMLLARNKILTQKLEEALALIENDGLELDGENSIKGEEKKHE